MLYIALNLVILQFSYINPQYILYFYQPIFKFPRGQNFPCILYMYFHNYCIRLCFTNCVSPVYILFECDPELGYIKLKDIVKFVLPV